MPGRGWRHRRRALTLLLCLTRVGRLLDHVQRAMLHSYYVPASVGISVTGKEDRTRSPLRRNGWTGGYPVCKITPMIQSGYLPHNFLFAASRVFSTVSDLPTIGLTKAKAGQRERRKLKLQFVCCLVRGLLGR